MYSKPFVFALIILPYVLQGALAQLKSSELDSVMERAAQYVERYENKELGTLLVTENYQQSATFFAPDGKSVVGKPQRRLESDFLILQVGADRVAVRKVNRVDGLAVKSKETSLEDLMNDSPARIQKRRAVLREENSHYDIGGVLRENNTPTFALRVVRKNEAMRFNFEKKGTSKVNGTPAWEVKFQEETGPTLLNAIGGAPLYSSGTLWIEPETGRILKTEFVVDNPLPRQKAHGQSIVTYADNKKLGILVPDLMIEHYESEESYVNCRAEYSNFRSFNVDVNTTIGR